MGIHVFSFEVRQAGHPYAIFEARNGRSPEGDPVARGVVPAIEPPWTTVSVVKRLPVGVQYVALAVVPPQVVNVGL